MRRRVVVRHMPRQEFDREFARSERTARRAFKAILVAAVAWFVVLLGLLGAAAYVAWHFLSKAW